MQFVATENNELINLVNHLFVKVNFIDTNVTQCMNVGIYVSMNLILYVSMYSSM